MPELFEISAYGAANGKTLSDIAAGDEIGAGADDAKQRLERSFCGVGRKYAERAAQQRRCSAGRLDENEVARLRGLGDRRTLERHVPDAGRHFLLCGEA